MKILFVSPGGSERPDYLYRYETLRQAICLDSKHSARVVYLDSAATAQVSNDLFAGEENVVILHSSIIGSRYKMIQKWKVNGKMVIADLCQPVWFEEMQMSDWFGRSGKGYTRELFTHSDPHSNGRSFRLGLQLADGILCNSRKMVEDWNERTGVFYLPDFINLDEYLIHGYDSHPGVVIGIKLLHSGFEKLIETGLFSAIEAVGKIHTDAKFLFYGDMINVHRMIELKAEQKIYIPSRDINDWQKVLPSIDLGLIPLSGLVDERRGWEDALEYMAMKIPWVGSNSIALSDLREYGWTVQNHDGIWKRVISDMVGNITAYKAEAASEPYLFAIGQGVDDYIEKLYKIINQIQVKPSLGVTTKNVPDEYFARR